MAYLSELEKNKIQPLFEVLSDPAFPLPELENLLSDILFAREESLQSLRPWIETGHPKYKISLYSTAELALDSLARQPKAWLDELAPFFEKILVRALTEKDEEVLDRLKSLFSEAGAGLRPAFLQRILYHPPVTLSQSAKLDIWLLRAKLSDDLEEPERSGFEQELNNELKRHPWLLVVMLHNLRETDPFSALELLRLWDDMEEYKPSAEVEAYAAVYLRHAMYNLLHDGSWENYNRFFSLFHSLKMPYIRELIQKTQKHELLTDIANKCAQHDNTHQQTQSVLNRMQIKEELASRLN